MNRKSVCLLAALQIFVLSCERKGFEIGQRTGPVMGAPEYVVNASLSTTPGPAHMQDVLPKQGGGGLDPLALYVKNCAGCHQPAGQGIPAVFPPLANSPYVASDNVERLAAIMLYGLVGPIKVNNVQYTNVMAPLGGSLSDEELASIATYIRVTWNNKPGAVDPAVFAAARKKFGTRGPFNIQELGEEQ